MSDQKTTISVGFKTDSQGLTDASRKVNDLKRALSGLKTALPGSARISDAIPGKGNLRARRVSDAVPGKGDLWRQVGQVGGTIPGRIGGRIGGTAMRAGIGGLAAFGMATGVVGAAVRAVSSAKEYLSVLDPLAKQLSIVGQGQDEFVEKLERTGVAIGKNKTEMMRLTQAYVALAGQQGGGVGRQVGVMSLLSKGMGVNANVMASSMGSMGQMGAFGQHGGMRVEQFAAVLADAVARGRMKGREQELFSSMQSLMGAQLSVLTRLAPGSSTAMIGALTAMNASGRPGLMGIRGANVLGRIDQGFRNPQGDFGEYFMYNALGGGDYFDYRMQLEKGIFGDGNLQSVMGHLKKNIKGDKARWYTMSKMFGISMDQARSIEGLNLQGNQGFLKALEGATGGSLENISADKLGLMAEIYNSSGKKREALLKDSRISGLAKAGGWTAETGTMDVLKGIATGSMAATKQEAMVSSLTSIDNRLIKIGEAVVPGMTKIVESVNKIVSSIVDDRKVSTEQKEAAKELVAESKLPLEGVAAYTQASETDRRRWNRWHEMGDEASAAVKASRAAKEDPNANVSKQISDGIKDVLNSSPNFHNPANVNINLKVKNDLPAGDGSAVKVQR